MRYVLVLCGKCTRTGHMALVIPQNVVAMLPYSTHTYRDRAVWMESLQTVVYIGCT